MGYHFCWGCKNSFCNFCCPKKSKQNLTETEMLAKTFFTREVAMKFVQFFPHKKGISCLLANATVSLNFFP